MGRNSLVHAAILTAAVLFSVTTPVFAQDKCRTSEDEAEIKRLQAEIDKLQADREQIGIDWRAHQARYNTLTSGLPKTQKLVDEAAATINSDAERYKKTGDQIVKDADAIAALQAKPCPPPKDKPAKGGPRLLLCRLPPLRHLPPHPNRLRPSSRNVVRPNPKRS